MTDSEKLKEIARLVDVADQCGLVQCLPDAIRRVLEEPADQETPELDNGGGI